MDKCISLEKFMNKAENNETISLCGWCKEGILFSKLTPSKEYNIILIDTKSKKMKILYKIKMQLTPDEVKIIDIDNLSNVDLKNRDKVFKLNDYRIYFNNGNYLGNVFYLFTRNRIYFQEWSKEDGTYYLWCVDIGNLRKEKVIEKGSCRRFISGCLKTETIAINILEYPTMEGGGYILNINTKQLVNLPAPNGMIKNEEQEIEYISTQLIGRYSFSANGKKLACTADDDGQIYIVDLDKNQYTKLEILSNDEIGFDIRYGCLEAVWNSVYNNVISISTYYKNEFKKTWMINLKNNEKYLLFDYERDLSKITDSHIRGPIVWSPDGNKICIQTEDNSLWIANIDISAKHLEKIFN
jgi:hypothetical protein